MLEKMMKDGLLCTLRISVEDMIALGVRNRSAGAPELLYQHLPMPAMPLMATLPRGSYAVSVPLNSARCRGFFISAEKSSRHDGYSLVYARKQNNRYEAVAVQYEGKEYSLEEFHTVAQQWVDGRLGGLRASGRYASFVLSKEEWSLVLRDHGYVAWDAIPANPDLSPLTRNPVIRVRIPVYAGKKESQDEGLRVFSQVEILPDSFAGLSQEWISFKTYQDLRAVRSVLPADFMPDLTDWFASLAKKCGVRQFTFRPGMLFGEPMEWWGDGSRRRTVHEGIDFAEGIGPAGEKYIIQAGTPVQSISDGEVIAVLDDFIGKTVVLRHNSIRQLPGDVFHSFLSHILPEPAGSGVIAKGTILGRVAQPESARVSPHLHLSCAWIPEDLCVQEIGLAVIHPGFTPVVLVNPCRLPTIN